jgi:hypothetical protein
VSHLEPLFGERIRLLRYRGPEQRSREGAEPSAESNTVRALTPCQTLWYTVARIGARGDVLVGEVGDGLGARATSRGAPLPERLFPVPESTLSCFRRSEQPGRDGVMHTGWVEHVFEIGHAQCHCGSGQTQPSIS